MSNLSVVQFETKSRVHIALAVKDLERSVGFYQTLLGQEPTKTQPRYAKFEVAQPPLNLSLNEVGGETGPNNPVAHFGIQVKSTGAVSQTNERLIAAGIASETQENVTCCYAVQHKVWAADPDGNKWEVYVVLDDQAGQHASTQGDCCRELPANMEMVEREDATASPRGLEHAGGMAACPCLASPALRSEVSG